MLRQLIEVAIRGLAKELAINPRNIRLLMVLDEIEEHLLARIDASNVRELLRRKAHDRVLRIQVGNVAYDINLGGNVFKDRPRVRARAPKQRGV